MAWDMVCEYGGIEDQPSIHYRMIPPMALGTTPSRTSPRDLGAQDRGRRQDGFRREDVGGSRARIQDQGNAPNPGWW